MRDRGVPTEGESHPQVRCLGRVTALRRARVTILRRTIESTWRLLDPLQRCPQGQPRLAH